MTDIYSTDYERALARFTESDWLKTLDSLMPEIHEVDRTATLVWFRFFPLELHNYLKGAEDPDKTLQGLAMQGDYDLADQIGSSHRFLYGSRYWNQVADAVLGRTKESLNGDPALADEIRTIASSAAKEAGVSADLLTGISAVGLMTLRQAGSEKMLEAGTSDYKPKGLMAKSPQKVLEGRVKDPARGFFDFLKTVDKEFVVRWDENDPKARFEIILEEEIASAAARDGSRNWLEKDERCIEGVIPVECRSAACGTCWVGVIGGAENLSDVAPLERKQMKVFGYGQGDEKRPFMRLACQAAAEGSVSIVIPPWNAVFGKKVYDNVDEVELEPATTSAARLRESISEVLDG